MATITVRDLDDEVESRLRVRAAENARSMEAEARAILEEAVRPSRPERRWAGLQKARALAAEVCGLDDVFANIAPRDDHPRENPFGR